MRRLALVFGAAACAASLAQPLAAQRVRAWVDASASHSRPPAAVGTAATYGLLGGSLTVESGAAGTFEAAGQGGRGLNGGGNWVSGSAAAAGAWRFGAGAFALRAEGFGLHYTETVGDADSRYTAAGVSLEPRLRAYAGSALFSVYGTATRGIWRNSFALPVGGGLPGFGSPPLLDDETEDGTLSLVGGGLEAGLYSGGTLVQLTGEALRAANGVSDGWHRGAGVALTFAGEAADFGLSARLRQTPGVDDGVENHLGYHASVGLPMGPARLHLQVGRSVPDPLLGTPASFSAEAGLRIRLVDHGRAGPRPVVEVLDQVSAGRRVRFRVEAPGANRAAIAGDFNEWTPAPMRQEGSAWILELTLEPGVYRFSFVLDGEEWMVPDHAPGITDDGWGKRNATLVVPG